MIDYGGIREKLDERLKEPLSGIPSDAQFDFWSVSLGWTDRCLNEKMNADPIIGEKKYEVFKKIIKNEFKVLDAGCGDGLNLEWIAKNFPESKLELFGFDLSRLVLSCAKDRLKFYSSVNFTNNPIECIPYDDESFDVVTCFSVLQYAQDPIEALAELERVLKRNRHLIIYKQRAKHYDPFLVPTIYGIIKKTNKSLNKEDNLYRKVFSPRGGKEVEELLQSYLLDNSDLKIIDRKPFLAGFNFGFYMRVASWSINLLPNLSYVLNKLPFNYYRVGEFIILQKRAGD